jgi:glycine/D-amino acid oxidase-like deaminating enzyme
MRGRDRRSRIRNLQKESQGLAPRRASRFRSISTFIADICGGRRAEATSSEPDIIIGGEDSEEVIEPEARDRLIPEKSRLLLRKLAALWPAANIDIECRWSGTFDTTSDGLPLIGPVPGAKGVYAAYGYGGNGITFSFLAAQLIGDLIAGWDRGVLRKCDAKELLSRKNVDRITRFGVAFFNGGRRETVFKR